MSHAGLRRAIATEDPDQALRVARTYHRVPLCDASAIVALLAENRHPLYDQAARRFLVRVVEEVDAPLEQIKILADILAFVHDEIWGERALWGLRRAVEQLHDRDVRLRLTFDSREG